MTPYSSTVYHQLFCNVNIAVADDSVTTAKKKSVRKFRLEGIDKPVTVSLTNKFLAPDAAMSLLSVPAIAEKDIGVLFLYGKAYLFGLKNINYVLGYAEPEGDYLSYVYDNQDEVSFDTTSDTTNFCKFMAVASNKKVQEINLLNQIIHQLFLKMKTLLPRGSQKQI